MKIDPAFPKYLLPGLFLLILLICPNPSKSRRANSCTTWANSI